MTFSGPGVAEGAPGKPRLVGADASHAWVAVWCPGHGWIEYDPTNGIQPDLRHVTLGWGRDFQDVSPLRGVIYTEAESSKLDVGVDVIRLADPS